jgi:hypothetical protein
MYKGNSVLETSLQVLVEDVYGPRTIYRSFSTTSFFSLYINRYRTYWKTAEFVIRRLRDLHRCGWGYIRSLDCFEETASCAAGSSGTPGNLTMVRFLARLLLNSLRRGTRPLIAKEQWALAIRRREAAIAGNGSKPFHLLVPPADRFYADPFLFKKGCRNYVFFEEYPFDTRKGLISCLEIDSNGRRGEPQVVLERAYHLSYPFVFEWQGEVYMIPETSANRTVELYRAASFPHRWVLEKVLMEGIQAVDATLAWHKGKVWLFTCIGVEGKLDDELHVFFADSPLGPWKPHPHNPVVSDVRRARPAGRLFSVHGRLFRPAQDCSGRYGQAIVLNRVEVLSETTYREVLVGRVDASWLPEGLGSHTFNFNDDLEVLDAEIRVATRSWPFPFRRRNDHFRGVSWSGDPSGYRVASPLDIAAGLCGPRVDDQGESAPLPLKCNTASLG